MTSWVWVLITFLVSSQFTSALSFRDTAKKDKFLVPELPGLKESFKDEEIPLMFAGQLELYRENQSHLFFWKYSDPQILPEYKKRTIFWLNGGPGCSSMDGALMEVGPFRINSDKKVTKNKGSWHHAGDLVFVDQPAGTGFSFTDEYDHDLDQVAFQFLKFMELYYEMFPEDIDNEIYFAGESYAGQYIPYIADAILKRNKNLKSGQTAYNLKGLLIGNGWIAPDFQSLSYLPYSIAAGLIDQSNKEWGNILRQHEKCQNVVNSVSGDKMIEYEIVSNTCEQILNLILAATRDDFAPSDQQCYNMYDYTLKDSYPSCGMNWPPDLDNVGPFLNTKEVQHDLNLVKHKKWHECSGKVGRFFSAKNSVPSVKLLPGLLEQIPIVLFNGNRDIICNYLGTENFIKEMKWNGATGFQQEEQYDWIYDDNVSGYIKTERNLTYVNVFDSSHMVPFDMPEVSRSLIDLLVGNYDIKSVGNVGGIEKKAVITYPLGQRKVEEPKPVSSEAPVSSAPTPTTTSSQTKKPVATSVIGTWAQFASETAAPPAASSSSTPNAEESGTSRITRLIQFVVLVILVWGVYVLYAHYRSGPSSIIKTKPSSRKKNVQWADQLRQFQEDNEEPVKSSFLSKAFNKLKRSDGRGVYAPTSTDEYLDDIEMNSVPHPDEVDQFIIDSDDETPVDQTNHTDGHKGNQKDPGNNSGI